MNVIHNSRESLFINAFFDNIHNRPYLFFPQDAMIPTFAQINDVVSLKFETNAFHKGVVWIDVYVTRFDSFTGQFKDGFQIGSVSCDHFVKGSFELNHKFKKNQKSGKSHHVLVLFVIAHHIKGTHDGYFGMAFRLFSKDDVKEIRCNKSVEEKFQKLNEFLGVHPIHWCNTNPQGMISTRRKRKRSNEDIKGVRRKKKKIAQEESKTDIVDELAELKEASATFLSSFCQ